MRSPRKPRNVIPLASEAALPMELTGAVVLVASLLLTAAWVLYLYR